MASAPAMERESEVIAPGFHAGRMLRLIQQAVSRCCLDLTGLTVLTEAATGAYASTPVIAALAGARHVYALTKTTRFGTVEEVRAATMHLARAAGVDERITILNQRTPELFSRADIVTNSGHLRPLNAEAVFAMKPSTVISLMYESWELRPEDLDLEACRKREIRVAGVNERHPNVDVFSFLGPLAAKELMDAGIAVYGSRILLLCDNAFAPFIDRCLRAMGAEVDLVSELVHAASEHYDALLVSATPRAEPVISAEDAELIARRWPEIVVAQFFGDCDRAALDRCEIRTWPERAPAKGHMGVLLTEIGPDAIVRLQTGGLKVGEVLARGSKLPASEQQYIQPVI